MAPPIKSHSSSSHQPTGELGHEQVDPGAGDARRRPVRNRHDRHSGCGISPRGSQPSRGRGSWVPWRCNRRRLESRAAPHRADSRRPAGDGPSDPQLRPPPRRHLRRGRLDHPEQPSAPRLRRRSRGRATGCGRSLRRPCRPCISLSDDDAGPRSAARRRACSDACRTSNGAGHRGRRARRLPAAGRPRRRRLGGDPGAVHGGQPARRLPTDASQFRSAGLRALGRRHAVRAPRRRSVPTCAAAGPDERRLRASPQRSKEPRSGQEHHEDRGRDGDRQVLGAADLEHLERDRRGRRSGSPCKSRADRGDVRDARS